MAEMKSLAATVRGGCGKGAARSVRREGRIPAVVYGGGEAALPISLDYKTVNQLIYAGHFLTTIFELDVDGSKERVIPRDYQLDVVRDTPLHIDFLRLKPGAKLRVNVPVHFTNRDTSPGIKKGGALNIVLHAVEMYVPVDAIPDGITVDLAKLDINDSVHIQDVSVPEGCRPTVAGNFTIASMAPPSGGSEAAPAAGAAAPATAAKAAPAAKAPAAKAAAAPAKAPDKKK